MSNLGLWEPGYRLREPFPYGTDLTYRLGAEFLAGCPIIEDWGCGTQWFRRVMQGVNPSVQVIGLDGSGAYCDQIVDLAEYRPDALPDGLFLRHVLEHNRDWRTILDRALESFTQRMMLILFTPLMERETLLSEYQFPTGGSCPYLALSQGELEQILTRHGLNYRMETMPSPETEFGLETVWWIQRIGDTADPTRASPFESSGKGLPLSNQYPFVSCLCPTYRRPALLANALACFLAQDYPADRRELLILDDAGQFVPQSGPGWELVSQTRRFRSLPEKFNALAGLARGDILVVWEDDDIYLPWHISYHAATLTGACQVSKPSRVRSHVNGAWHEEGAAGRFHASLAFTRHAFDAVGGWPLTQRGDFDQRFLSWLGELGPMGDPTEHYPPSYVFRWECTNAYHGQGFMQGPDDEEWFRRANQQEQVVAVSQLVPQFDENARTCFQLLGISNFGEAKNSAAESAFSRRLRRRNSEFTEEPPRNHSTGARTD